MGAEQVDKVKVKLLQFFCSVRIRPEGEIQEIAWKTAREKSGIAQERRGGFKNN